MNKILLCSGDRIEGREIILIEGKSIDMSKSKNEIFGSHTPNREYPSYWHESDIEQMMDVWAKFQAISFDQWKHKNKWVQQLGFDTPTYSKERAAAGKQVFFSSEELFNEFLKDQSV